MGSEMCIRDSYCIQLVEDLLHPVEDPPHPPLCGSGQTPGDSGAATPDVQADDAGQAVHGKPSRYTGTPARGGLVFAYGSFILCATPPAQRHGGERRRSMGVAHFGETVSA